MRVFIFACLVICAVSAVSAEVWAGHAGYCASCHLERVEHNLAGLGWWHAESVVARYDCPGVRTAEIEMKQIEDWFIGLERNLTVLDDRKAALNLREGLRHMGGAYRAALAKPVGSTREIVSVLRDVQDMLDSKVHRKMLSKRRAELFRNALGLFFFMCVFLAGFYLWARTGRLRDARRWSETEEA